MNPQKIMRAKATSINLAWVMILLKWSFLSPVEGVMSQAAGLLWHSVGHIILMKVVVKSVSS